MAKKIFSGVATALVTPFCEDGVDYSSFERLIEYQIESGVDALVFCGTTGEAPTLDEREKREIFSFARKTVGKRVPIILGTGTNDHKRTMRLCEYAASLEPDAMLCVSPYYNKGTEDGIVRSFFEICSCGIPVILYNVPTRTGVDIKGELLSRLFELDRICAIKECAGVGRISEHICRYDGRFSVYTGNDSELLPSLSVGADGVISVLSNLYPSMVKALYTAYRKGEVDSAAAIHKSLHEISALMFCETNPAPIKYCLSKKGLCKNLLRLPMSEAGAELCKKIDKEMKKIEQNI